jgi:hypothetical protein
VIPRPTTPTKRLRTRSALAVVALTLLAGSVIPIAAASAASVPAVTYHGGPVEHSSNVYAIFWTPSGYSFPSGYATLVSQYFTDVAHDSYTASNVYSVTNQYYNGAGASKKFASYNVSFKGAIVDTNPFPAKAKQCPSYPLGDSSMSEVCLTGNQIENKVRSVVASRHLPKGMDTNYFLFTPQGVASCKKGQSLAGGGCNNPVQYNGFCAFHAHVGAGTKAIIYANMPYAAIAGCASGQSPNGNPADSVLNNIAHEQNESMSDPLGNGWYDNTGAEIADKCHLTFGAARGATSTGQYNQVINGHGYWLQQLWSNRAGGCVQRNTLPQPVTTFTHNPTIPTHGKKVFFRATVHEAGESRFSYRWTFPDGGTSAARNPVHVFAGYYFASPVTLIVTDSHGSQTRTVNVISVA